MLKLNDKERPTLQMYYCSDTGVTLPKITGSSETLIPYFLKKYNYIPIMSVLFVRYYFDVLLYFHYNLLINCVIH